MYTYQLFIDDDRYAVTTLRMVAAPDEAQARELAETAMRESPHHAGVELYRGERRLLGLGSLGEHGAGAARRRVAGF